MRIAMISTPFLSVPPRDYGGTELAVYELTEGLVEQGHEVTLFGTGDSRTRAELRWLYAQPQWPPEVLTDLNRSLLDGFDRAGCRERAVERFGRRRMVAAYERLYRRALGESHREGPPRIRAA